MCNNCNKCQLQFLPPLNVVSGYIMFIQHLVCSEVKLTHDLQNLISSSLDQMNLNLKKFHDDGLR